MKNIKFFLLALMMAACSADSDSSSKDGTGGSLAVFALKGNFLYTVDESKLSVFSLANIQQPEKVNEVNVGWNIETLFSTGDYLFIGSRNGMYIYSIIDPQSPTLLSTAQHFTSCDPVVANQTHSFVTLHTTIWCGNNLNKLMVYNTQNPSNPILLHERNMVSPKGLGLYNQYLFVCDDQIRIFSIASPQNPTLVKSLDKSCFDVIIKDNDLFAIGEGALYRYKLNPDNIQEIILKSTVTF